MKCIAIDDEPIALHIIRQYCERRGNIQLETYSSPKLGMMRIKEWHPDIVLLDIEMNGISGIELARELPASCCLIFTTAYAHYALDGFEVNAIDFLHKPYFYERFDRALQKAEKWLHMNDLLNISQSASRQLLLKSGYKNVTVSIDTILYIESMDNYIKICNIDGTSILSKMTLRNIKEQLPEGEFIHIHRSFLVPKNKIIKFTHSEVTLVKNGKTLPIGKKYVNTVTTYLKKEEP